MNVYDNLISDTSSIRGHGFQNSMCRLMFAEAYTGWSKLKLACMQERQAVSMETCQHLQQDLK